MSAVDKSLHADAEEIAAAIGKHITTVRKMSDDWASVEEKTRSRHPKKWFAIDQLPKAIREKVSFARLNATLRLDDGTKALIAAKAEQTPVVKPAKAVAVKVDPASLDDKQRERDGSRQLILQFCATFQGSLQKAVDAMNAGYAAGDLHPDLMHAIRHCNDKANEERIGKLSASTVDKWRRLRNETGSCVPKKTRVQTRWQDVYWLPLMLASYRKPQKPNLTEAHAEFKKDWAAQGFVGPCPSYDAAFRLFKKMPRVVLEMGRSTGSELAALRPFVRRDWSGMSNEVWVGDGHTFKAKVRHPDHGQPFAPEVTVIIDAASRFIVGWAFSLSENQIAVSEALGKGMLAHGKPLIYYSDNGSGQTAKTIDCPAGGMLARMGVHHETGIPGNPQGRGIIEGLWDITTIAVAKTMPTFQGTGMDGDTVRKNTQAINRAKTLGQVPDFVPSWQAFMAACEERFDWYNRRHQHGSLGGKTPAEVYFANFDPTWHCPLSDDEKINLYRPFVERVPVRGEVRWINNIYFHQDLAELPANTKVRVAYDMHDASVVWVSDLQGKRLCEAVWDGNKRAGFPVSLKDALKETRIDGMEKRGQAAIDKAHAERGNVIEGEVLQRVPLIPAETVEPLKRIVIDGGDFSHQQPEEKRLSYLETMQILQDDSRKAVGEE